MLTKDCSYKLCRLRTGTYGFLAKPVEYHLFIAKTTGPNIDSWGTPQFMVPAFEKTA